MRGVPLTLVGGDPLAGDPRLMGRLKASGFETVRSSYLEPTFGLRADGSLNAQAIALSPLLPWDDEDRFGLIEGRTGGLPYPTNRNHIPVTGPNPFAGFEQRWYARP